MDEERGKIVYDTVNERKGRPPSDKGKKRCQPLTLESVSTERAPIDMFKMQNVESRSGAYNVVYPAFLRTEQCAFPVMVVRTAVSELDEKEIIRTIAMAEAGIGPDVYAITKDTIFLRLYHSDLIHMDYSKLDDANLDKLAFFIAKLCRKTVNRGYYLQDLYARNVVVHLHRDNGVEDVRFIDFDPIRAHRRWFKSNKRNRDTFYFTMLKQMYQSYVVEPHIYKPRTAAERVARHLRPYLISAATKLGIKATESTFLSR